MTSPAVNAAFKPLVYLPPRRIHPGLSRAFGLSVLAGALLLTACDKAPPPAPPGPPAPILQGNQLRFPANHPQLALIGLSTAEPSRDITVELPAKLVWNEERTQRIYPSFAGRVATIRADVGQSVQPGAVLAQLASPDFGMAQADTAKAQATLSLSQKALKRQQELYDAGIVAKKELEQSQADVAAAAAEHDRALARTRLYGSGAGVNQQLALTATLSGIVVERNINPGQELRPDQSGPGIPPLFVVSDPSSLWVQVDAREVDIGSLRPGNAFELVVPALGNQKFTGKVITAADYIDPSTRTIKVRGLVTNPDRLLKAEMLATARVQRAMPAGVVVPASAVILRGSKQFVFVQVQPGVFEPREVTRAFESASQAVLTQGLQAGDKVVSENVLLLGKQFRDAVDDARGGKEAANLPAFAAPVHTKPGASAAK